ncbi:NUDIX hydrolase [Streptomyces sp. MNU76]|uniref:NUDIX domain-containing protein n=1 Tax=Streptomyces sp. MNU76 TaxID=2560026 RepID=UPI001E561BDA|nr:NUDIX hydrolase [Streptomyces sp. MNU76]MCC9707356.1 NUDIX hydrolase [Streptomyces sp. MNU76]
MNAYLPLREAARAVLLDADHRVLLLRYAAQGGYWATPGGSLEESETQAAATLRELNEELGISPTSSNWACNSLNAARNTWSDNARSDRSRDTSSSTPPRLTSTWTKPPNASTSRLTAGGRWANSAVRAKPSTPRGLPT